MSAREEAGKIIEGLDEKGMRELLSSLIGKTDTAAEVIVEELSASRDERVAVAVDRVTSLGWAHVPSWADEADPDSSYEWREEYTEAFGKELEGFMKRGDMLGGILFSMKILSHMEEGADRIFDDEVWNAIDEVVSGMGKCHDAACPDERKEILRCVEESYLDEETGDRTASGLRTFLTEHPDEEDPSLAIEFAEEDLSRSRTMGFPLTVEHNALRLYELLSLEEGHEEEKDALCSEFGRSDTFRKRAVEKAEERGDDAELLVLLRDLVRERYERILTDERPWMKLYMAAAEKEDSVPDMIWIYRRMLLSDPSNREIYEKLTELLPEGGRDGFMEELLSSLEGSMRYRLMATMGRDDELMEIYRKSALEGGDEAEAFILDSERMYGIFPDETVDILKSIILDKERIMPEEKNYGILIHLLSILSKMEKGKDTAHALAKRWRSDYRNRRRFMKMLDENGSLHDI